MKIYNHITFSLIAVMLAATTFSRAQWQGSDSTSLHEGVWAMQFGVTGLLSLRTFQGSTLGAKYQLSDTHALRVGVTVYGNSDDQTGSYSESVNDTSYGSNPSNYSSASATVSLLVHYIWYAQPVHFIHLYGGVGPLVSYYNYNHTETYPDLYTYTDAVSHERFWVVRNYKSESKKIGAGISGAIGVEWFAIRWLSFHAEYNQNALYQWGSTSTDNSYSVSNPPTDSYYPTSNSMSRSTTGWSISSGVVLFGMSVYL